MIAEQVVEHPAPTSSPRRRSGSPRGSARPRAGRPRPAKWALSASAIDDAEDGLDRHRERGEHQRVPDGAPPLGIGQQVVEVVEADGLRRLEVVQLGVGEREPDRPPERPAPPPAASTTSIGARNSQAGPAPLPRQARGRRRPVPRTASASARGRRQRGAAYQCPPRESRSSRFSSAGQPPSCRRSGRPRTWCAALKNSATHLVVLLARHLRRPRHRVREGLVERAEERHRLQHLRVLVERGDRRVVGALDRAALLLLGRGQVLDEVGRGVRVLAVLRDRELPAAERAPCARRPPRPSAGPPRRPCPSPGCPGPCASAQA